MGQIDGDSHHPGGAGAGGVPGPGMGGGGGIGPGPGPGPGGAGMQEPTVPAKCQALAGKPGPAPLRRLTRFEYNNTVRELFGDTSSPANTLPAEELGNGFGNDATAQAVSSLLAEEYGNVAEGIAARATQTSAALGRLASCASTVAAGAEESCARTIIEGLVPRAFRRPLAAGEADPLLGVFRATRMLSGATFASSVAAVIEAVLLSPDFLYRLEFGVPDKARPGVSRPSGDEMAVRLSYLLWGSMPDEALRAAAKSGELATAQGVLAQATRMLDDQRSHRVVRFFFDNLLPINGLSDLERDKMLYPSYTAAIGALMQEETQRTLEYEIYQGGGTWPAALTSSTTFLNGPLAAFYGTNGVQGSAFQKVALEQRRLGFITQAGVMAGTTHSNRTNPVVRGSFVVQRLLCMKIPLPDASIADKVKPPDPYSGKTARERYTKHSTDPVCRSCHGVMDPVGFSLENFDAVGLYRERENDVVIDASGELPGGPGTFQGPVEMVRQLAALPEAQRCFATHWIELGFGKTLSGDDECLQAQINLAFYRAGYNVRQLLLALTQSDAFLYLPGGP